MGMGRERGQEQGKGQAPHASEIQHLWVLLENHMCLLAIRSRHWKDESKYRAWSGDVWGRRPGWGEP